jgi:hypothetical protein
MQHVKAAIMQLFVDQFTQLALDVKAKLCVDSNGSLFNRRVLVFLH